jgi:phage baseplate assembly protein W
MADDFPQQFDVPFRFDPVTGDVAVVEQDSVEDIANCVQIVCLTRQGQRDEDPTFGLPEMALSRAPIDPVLLLAHISASEPRAKMLIETAPALYDEAISNAGIQVAI